MCTSAAGKAMQEACSSFASVLNDQLGGWSRCDLKARFTVENAASEGRTLLHDIATDPPSKQ